MIPFLMLGGAAGGLAWNAGRSQKAAAALQERIEIEEQAEHAPAEEPISSALHIDELRLELGYGLLPLINEGQGDLLTDQIKALRRQIASEMGFVMPSVRILDNMQLEANTYMIKVKEVEAGKGDVHIGQFMVMDPQGQQVDLPGAHTTEPTFGLPATWIDASLREEADFKGYTVVDPATVISTHLTEILKSNMAELLSYAEVQKLLDELPSEHQKLVDDIVPSQISVTGIQRILQALLAERISIRDLATILEGVAEAASFTSDTTQITEHVRSRLSRQICAINQGPQGYLALLALSPQWEMKFGESLVGQGEDRQLAMAPSDLQDFITCVRERFEEAALEGEMPVMLTSPAVRPYVRSIIERFRPQTVVLAQSEIHPQAKLKTVGQI